MGCKVCRTSAKNTGIPSTTTVDITVGYFLVPLVASDGTKNMLEIGGGTAANGGYSQDDIEALINQADPSKRWYPINDLKNVSETRADSIFEEYEGGSKAKIQDGVLSFTAKKVDVDFKYLKKLRALVCTFKGNLGLVKIDVCSDLIGAVGVNGTDEVLVPVPIDTASADIMFMRALNTTAANNTINFDIQRYFNDEDFCVFRANYDNELGEGINLLNVTGLIDWDVFDDTDFAADSSSQEITGPAVADFGGVQGEPLDLPASAYEFYNVTQAGAIVPDTVAYDDVGLATWTFPAASFAAADVINPGLAAATTGYSDEQVEDIAIVAT